MRPPGLGFRDHSPKAKNPLRFLSHVFFLVWILGLPPFLSLSSKLSCLCGQNEETLWKLFPRAEHTWKEDTKRDEGWKEGLLTQHACTTSLGWPTRLPGGCCLFWFFAKKMGFPCAPHSIYQFPLGKSILVTRHERTYYRTVSVLGNRSTSFWDRW